MRVPRILVKETELVKVRLTRSPMRLFELGAAAPLLVLRPGPLLQAVSHDLELHLQVGQDGKGALQLRQELIRIERGIARFRASTAAFKRIKIEHLHFRQMQHEDLQCYG